MKIFGNNPTQTGTVHFIGIGGIGMSGLAEMLARNGFKVQGSDQGHGYTEEHLKQAGATLFVGHAAEQLGDARLVVVSTAIKETNPELAAAKAQGIKVVHRADVLAEIMKNYQTVAVAGTHGKTTTTALVYSALKAGGVPVGIINGGVLNDVGSNIVAPPKAGDWLVVEADESDASFLKLNPTVAVITNIEAEHMDTYGTEEKLLQAFVDFATSAQEAIICAEEPNGFIVQSRAEPQSGGEVISYGIDVNSERGFDVYATMFTPQGRAMAFDAVLRGGVLDDVVVNTTGQHNVSNALAALSVAQLLKADMNAAADGLASFAGVGRRFSSVGHLNGDQNGAEIIDDYGHHPTEIATTLAAAKGAAKGKVITVIQPHRFTRLRDTLEAFAACAKVADGVILLPVYAAGESPIDGVNSDVLAEKMAETETTILGVVPDEKALRDLLTKEKLGKNDMVMCFGAGSISAMAKQLAHA